MSIDEIIEQLEIKMKRLFSFIPERLRPIYDEIRGNFSSRAVLLYGARGTGKTTFLLNIAKERDLLYVSADDPLVSYAPTYELFRRILSEYSGIVIDEITFLKDWSVVVKSLYDSFPDKMIYISGSSSAIVKNAVADLSRRFITVNLPIMSFREYVYFETGELFEKLANPFEDAMDFSMEVIRRVDVMRLFKDYKEGGTRPFYLEGNFKEKLVSTIEKSIFYDVPHFVGYVSENHLGVMKSLLSFLAFSKIPKINVEALCKGWRISKAKFYELLNVLEMLEVIKIARKKGRVRPYSKGSKIFFADPSAYFAYGGEVGNFREAFAFISLEKLSSVWACENEEECDFIFEDLKIEIGGKGKRKKWADFIVKDDIDVPVKNSIPLWILGMTW